MPSRISTRETPPGSLSDSLALALEKVHAGDDPTMPLGTSLVLLVTGREHGSEIETLSRLAQTSALGGVSVSVVGVGANLEGAAADRLALDGQGRQVRSRASFGGSRRHRPRALVDEPHRRSGRSASDSTRGRRSPRRRPRLRAPRRPRVRAGARRGASRRPPAREKPRDRGRSRQGRGRNPDRHPRVLRRGRAQHSSRRRRRRSRPHRRGDGALQGSRSAREHRLAREPRSPPLGGGVRPARGRGGERLPGAPGRAGPSGRVRSRWGGETREPHRRRS